VLPTTWAFATEPKDGEHFIAESELVITRLVTSKYKVRSFLLSPSRYERMRDDRRAGSGAPVYVCSAAR
jgi:hypothetical protein